MPNVPIRRLREVLVYSNPWVRVFFDEVEGVRGMYRQTVVASVRDGVVGAVVVAVDEIDRVAFVSIYRYPAKRWFFELPRGNADPREPLLAAAERELVEETGLVGRDFELVGEVSPDPALIGWADAVVVCRAEGPGKPQAEEGIDEVLWLDRSAIDQALKDGRIADGISISALRLAGR